MENLNFLKPYTKKYCVIGAVISALFLIGLIMLMFLMNSEIETKYLLKRVSCKKTNIYSFLKSFLATFFFLEI